MLCMTISPLCLCLSAWHTFYNQVVLSCTLVCGPINEFQIRFFFFKSGLLLNITLDRICKLRWWVFASSWPKQQQRSQINVYNTFRWYVSLSIYKCLNFTCRKNVIQSEEHILHVSFSRIGPGLIHTYDRIRKVLYTSFLILE